NGDARVPVLRRQIEREGRRDDLLVDLEARALPVLGQDRGLVAVGGACSQLQGERAVRRAGVDAVRSLLVADLAHELLRLARVEVVLYGAALHVGAPLAVRRQEE